MRLQLALDTLDLPEAYDLLDQLQGLIDIVEIGTPFLMRDGLRAVTEIDRRYPELTTLADLKIMDAGEYEANLAFDAGADIVTVLAAAHDVTVQGVIRAARMRGRQAMADLIAMREPAARASELDAMGVDCVCVHTATDALDQRNDPVGVLRQIRSGSCRCEVAVAGGITPDRLSCFASCLPDIVIVGSFITRHPQPAQAARAIRRSIEEMRIS